MFPNSSADYHIKFSPRWQAQATYELELRIPSTNEVFHYEIVGFGEEPLSKGNILLDCRARKPKSHKIMLSNPYNDREMCYLVKSDIPNFSGEENPITLAEGETRPYEFTVLPNRGGTYLGQITF